MQLTNYKGTQLEILIDRTIEILNNHEITNKISIHIGFTSVKAVGYKPKHD